MNKIKNGLKSYFKGIANADSDLVKKFFYELSLPLILFILIIQMLGKSSELFLFALGAFVLLLAFSVYRGYLISAGKYTIITGECTEVEYLQIKSTLVIKDSEKDMFYIVNFPKKKRIREGDVLKLIAPPSSFIETASNECHVNSFYILKRMKRG